jgi:hypothetical protein
MQSQSFVDTQHQGRRRRTECSTHSLDENGTRLLRCTFEESRSTPLSWTGTRTWNGDPTRRHIYHQQKLTK